MSISSLMHGYATIYSASPNCWIFKAFPVLVEPQ